MQNCKPAPTPMAAELPAESVDDPVLNDDDVAKYRTGVCTLLYISGDRPDIQFVVKELARHLRKPYESQFKVLKRLCRYLQGTAGGHIYFPCVGKFENALAYTDTNWGNCKWSRKSTSSGHLMISGCLLFSYSRTQNTVAGASGIAKSYGVTSVCGESLFVQGVLQRSDIDVKFKVMTDSSTAKSISQRLGVGKLRSIEIRTLWIQEIFQKKEFHIAKVPGSENFSDIGTKPLSAKVYIHS